MRRRACLLIALTPALMATSCPSFIRVHVEPGSPATAPELRFSYQRFSLRGVDSLAVLSCPPRIVYGAEYDSILARLPALWRIVRDTQAVPADAPLRITYGRAPAGYREQAPATPIQPGGCYHVRVTARVDSTLSRPLRWMDLRGVQTFRLLPDGRMITGLPVSPLLDSRAFRQTNRAAVGCARGYRRARTAADSAAVDAREHDVQDTALSCGWLRAHWPDVMSRPQTTERGVLGLLALAATAGLLAAIDTGERQE